MTTILTVTADGSRRPAPVLTRTAVVTGGAGGIGSAIGRRLAQAGYGVVVADIDAAAADAAAAGLPEVDGATHRGFAGDLTDSAVNRDLAEFAAQEAPIGVLVNAVGISPKRDGRKIPFYELTDAEWDQVLAVNVSAPFFLIREAFRHMPTDGSASIVNLLSITAKLGTGGLDGAAFPPHLPSTAAYAASKAALQNLTASLSRELAGHRIRVNGVAPGFVQTPMMGEVPPEGPLLDQVPMRRFARPEEIADAVAFLVSDQATYITGTSLDVNGGWLTC
ncbi:SDR family NAD(P)-dependent oxidoreductase [Georgenia thermotolerans]|uniref:SDR family oxidoreductase n=1 Tax=Georgenia thermotolerans TaxID=527326 RepID=A0A7J5UPZ0_9MICO|nr:SDR family oxidoreductase [Georgenia thermotolerans]KAE8764013.1 SDR family oxidoreductase [Georgenia thermotolerans]